jgi:hypothetical protein
MRVGWPYFNLRASGKFAVDLSGNITDIGGMNSIDRLLSVARKYAEVEGVPLSTVSSRIFSDGKRLAAIENGADLRSRTLEHAMSWLSERLLESDWPDEIPRPVSSEEKRTCAS